MVMADANYGGHGLVACHCRLLVDPRSSFEVLRLGLIASSFAPRPGHSCLLSA